MKLPILYSFRRCPYAMRARIAMYYSKINYEHREILLKVRPRKLYEISPKGTVPVLQLQDGQVIDESLDIMRWSIFINDPDSWFVNKKNEQLDAIRKNDQEFKTWLDRYKYHTRHPEFPVKHYRDKCVQILDDYERILDNKEFLFNQSISLGDMALLPFIRQFAYVDIKWFNQRFDNLPKWMENIFESVIFKSMMKKYDTWISDKKGEIIIFN